MRTQHPQLLLKRSNQPDDQILGHRVESGDWPQLPEQEPPAELASRATLEEALDIRQRMIERMVELEEEIATLQGRTELIDHGVNLPDEIDLEEATLVIHDRDGAVVGSWRIEEIEELKRSLAPVRLVPADEGEH